jgi:hemerythrin superfamily protein
MDATQLLTAQHRELEALLKQAMATKQPDARTRALSAVGDELSKHLLSEEQVFYPAVKARRNEDILLESLEEHLSLKRLVADLLDLDPSEPTWDAKLKVLEEQTEHHHKEEEHHLFPNVRKTFDEGQLEHLAQEILACQQALQREGSPREFVTEQTDEAAPLK